jgi:predicted Zn-dependent peptidase
VIGSMNDLDAATLDDVKTWFRTWYGPNNAVLVLAGDIDVATAREKAARYFGDIPASPSMAQPKVDIAERSQDTRQTMTDKVPAARIYRLWNVPQFGSEDLSRLELLSNALGGSGASRLDARLVHQDKLVDQVGTFVSDGQLGSQFGVMATVKQGVDPAKVEAIIDEELKRLLAEGPSADELARARVAAQAGFIRGIERIGGFGGKADALAQCAVFTGDAGCFRDAQRVLTTSTAAQVQAAGKRWLSKGSHTLVIEPGARVALPEEPAVTPSALPQGKADAKFTTTAGLDRSRGVPMPKDFPALKFPQLQRAKLKNGSTVVLAERHEIPVVDVSYQFDGGYSSDAEGQEGTASFAMGMLDQGAAGRSPLQFAAAAELLGARFSSGAGLDGGSAGVSALKSNLDASLGLYADMLRRPDFDQAEIERVKATWIAGIAQEKARPNSVAMRVLPPLLYGNGHPYSAPLTGSGTETSIGKLGRENLLAFQRSWLRPEQATVIVVGDTTLAEIVPLLDKHLGDWKGQGTAPAAVAVPQAPRPTAGRVYLIDQPGAVQANLFVGQLVPSSLDPGATAFDFANGVLGGDFTSRLNMNLREDKHWSYGARSMAPNALGQRPWMAVAPVQIDKTAPALEEMRKDIAAYASGQRPPSPEEVQRIRNIETLSLPGAYETAASVQSTIAGILRNRRPDDYVLKRKAEIMALTPQAVQAAAATLDPKALTWVVVGDLKQTEPQVRALGLGQVQVVDGDGKPVQPAAPAASRP